MLTGKDYTTHFRECYHSDADVYPRSKLKLHTGKPTRLISISALAYIREAADHCCRDPEAVTFSSWSPTPCNGGFESLAFAFQLRSTAGSKCDSTIDRTPFSCRGEIGRHASLLMMCHHGVQVRVLSAAHSFFFFSSPSRVSRHYYFIADFLRFCV